MDERIYWIWLSLACTPDTSTFPKLIGEFATARDVYEAEERDISRVVGYRNSDRTALLDKNLERAENIFNFCKKHNVGMLTYADEKYPQKLREIATPPILLYYRGIFPDFDRNFAVAAVGTRSLSDYGRRTAFKVSYDLAASGAIVVSGMAMGIDGVSHAGAISAGGVTVAVLGSGIDVCYPMQHKNLARAIVKNGCVITEFAPSTPPNKYNFPRRNRIISGLCAATVVFEGRERSGALITARCAKEQGRAVYALPGNVGSKNSEVSNLLLKNGAKLMTCADDIVNDFVDEYRGIINPFKLPVGKTVDMMNELSSLEVVALCPGDDVFEVPRTRPSKVRSTPQLDTLPQVISNKLSSEEDAADKFDTTTLRVYKKIPFGEPCSLESLVDEQINLREVMKCLLKLEMGQFVVMLPGELVARKS